MRVGVPKEIKAHEYRVGLTPGAVREYVAAGHRVAVETGAGEGIGASDESYRKAGATIVDAARDVFSSTEMIVKVKEPQPIEWDQLREDQILFTFLHLAADPEQTKGLIKSGCTATCEIMTLIGTAMGVAPDGVIVSIDMWAPGARPLGLTVTRAIAGVVFCATGAETNPSAAEIVNESGVPVLMMLKFLT